MANENSIFRSIEIIENRIAEKLTVENIASDVFFSKYHYQRLFREIIGRSVMEYITRRKLTLAGRDLLETGVPIFEIALKYGYDSHAGFTRCFKSYMGVTPADYRKYGLTAISQKIIKERCTLTYSATAAKIKTAANPKTVANLKTAAYSKTTDEIIRELNDFVVKAKETADLARKGSGLQEYAPFWSGIAGATDACADRVKGVLERITSIAERPDEITKRFEIIKIVEDAAFNSNLLAFNAGLMASRDMPERVERQWPLCLKYIELAKICVLKAGKVVQFLNELAALIFDDMHAAAADMLRSLTAAGEAAVSGISGYSYIKDELSYLADALKAASVEDLTVSDLEDYLFRLDIISFAADMDIFRNPKDKPMFDGLASFRENLAESIGFFGQLITPECERAPIGRSSGKIARDIAYQGNILLFYTRGEVSHEKLGHTLDDAQKSAFDAICEKINDFIQLAHKAEDISAYTILAGKLEEINADMQREADKLGVRGGAIKFIAREYENLANILLKYAGGNI